MQTLAYFEIIDPFVNPLNLQKFLKNSFENKNLDKT